MRYLRDVINYGIELGGISIVLENTMMLNGDLWSKWDKIH